MVKLARACQALARASWARSSAWVASPVMVRAKARRCGIKATSSALKAVSDAVALEPWPSIMCHS